MMPLTDQAAVKRKMCDRAVLLAASVPEPLMPRMARYTGQARHAESDTEFSLGKALSR